ncbi:MAG TPA: potassium transporter Kup [Longimicrobiales bacterium]|nr:potassium transporter Kup [Longimicrobiales bacterium]
MAHSRERGHSPAGHDRYFFVLALGALGIVYGDIGTSPLYALKECFGPHYGLTTTPENVLGILSLVFWALIVVISFKYIMFVMRADNRGEGGILALTALISPRSQRSSMRRMVLLMLGLFGASLLYGDGMITPAISVLSAVEGLSEVTPVFTPYVVPITVAILIVLFLFQKRGTAGVGAIFGPVMVLWFFVIAILGVVQIVREPSVLAAISPHHAVLFFMHRGWHGFLVLGSVFLVMTGGEALYADMGHFGRRPIRFAWFTFVLPALLLNYFGQGAHMLQQPGGKLTTHPFFGMAPHWALLPLVILATVATVIASQAVISGAFSLTRQAVQLGYSPRLQIDHTSEKEIGQIYIPSVNWALAIMTIALVLAFRSSTNLAAAYGVAVTTTMVITTILFYVVARERWHWSIFHIVPFVVFFLFIDLAFFGANILKLPQGGWVPLVIAGSIFALMDTWKRGRNVLSGQLRERTMPMDLFLSDIANHPERRVAGTAVFMTGTSDGVPPALLHNMKHNKVVHKTVVLLTVITEEFPHVPDEERVQVTELGHGFYRVVVHYGFTQDPSMTDMVAAMKPHGLSLHPMDTTFYLGRDTLITSKRATGLPQWRKALFTFMSRNARSATAYFGIPPNRVVELGAQIEI